jgi:proteasome lid subunit RPN8/RPN11
MPMGERPTSVRLSPEMVETIVAHLREEYPNEGCGVILGDQSAAAGGQATRFKPMRNSAASRYRFLIDPMDVAALDVELDETLENYWAVVHSHVASEAYPSPTDVAANPLFVNQVHLVVSLAEDEPVLNAFWIVEGAIHAVELLVGEG